MNITADFNAIPNFKRTCFLYFERSKLPPSLDPDEWTCMGDGVVRCLNPLTRALVHASHIIGLPTLAPINLTTWLYRCERMFAAGVSLLNLPDPATGDPIPVSFDPSTLRAHFGLKTNAPFLPDPDFEAHARAGHLHSIIERLHHYDAYEDEGEDKSPAPDSSTTFHYDPRFEQEPD